MKWMKLMKLMKLMNFLLESLRQRTRTINSRHQGKERGQMTKQYRTAWEERQPVQQVGYCCAEFKLHTLRTKMIEQEMG